MPATCLHIERQNLIEFWKHSSTFFREHVHLPRSSISPVVEGMRTRRMVASIQQLTSNAQLAIIVVPQLLTQAASGWVGGWVKRKDARAYAKRMG